MNPKSPDSTQPSAIPNHNSLGLSEITVLDESWFEILAHRKLDLILTSNSIPRQRLIGVFGSATVQAGSEVWETAETLGCDLAKRGAMVISGGYGGVMEAVSKGAATSGGIAVGVTCDNLPERAANQFVRQEWRVERWDQRLLALVWLADGYVVLPGSSGTLVELAMVIETQNKGFIPPRPIVCITEFWKPVVQMIEGNNRVVAFADTASEAVEILLK